MDRIIDDLHDLRHRVTAVGRRLADVRGDVASTAARPDRVETRLDRPERRPGPLPAEGGRP